MLLQCALHVANRGFDDGKRMRLRRDADCNGNDRRSRNQQQDDVSSHTPCYLTTVSVTSALITSPLTLSVATVNSVDCPSLRIGEFVVRNVRKAGTPRTWDD